MARKAKALPKGRSSTAATMSPKKAMRVSKKMAKQVDISTEKKHQTHHDKMDALLHAEKLEHIRKRRSNYLSR
jgi:ABC-type lipopolysaccharide export system ATPase subunit